MRQITVLCVGKLKEHHWKDAQNEFVKRLSPYMRLHIEEVGAEATGPTKSPRNAKESEGTKLLSRLDKLSGTVIALDAKGERHSSERFAELLDGITESGRHAVFVIGGTEGLSSDVADRAAHIVSLSDMTFTHEMARIFLLEQLYRAENILRGSAYHR